MSLVYKVITTQTRNIVVLIWILGLILTIPWALVFKVTHLNPDKEKMLDSSTQNLIHLPFCQELWPTKLEEAIYFLLVHVFACFIVPLVLIIICNVVTWKDVLSVSASSNTNGFTSCSVVRTSPVDMLRQRKIRMLKVFTGLTFTFFVFWLPLYVIMARLKFLYATKKDVEGTSEFDLISTLIPAAQLLGSCNSCVNPVLYALLNPSFRRSCTALFCRPHCSELKTSSYPTHGNNGFIAVVSQETV